MLYILHKLDDKLKQHLPLIRFIKSGQNLKIFKIFKKRTFWGGPQTQAHQISGGQKAKGNSIVSSRRNVSLTYCKILKKSKDTMFEIFWRENGEKSIFSKKSKFDPP